MNNCKRKRRSRRKEEKRKARAQVSDMVKSESMWTRIYRAIKQHPRQRLRPTGEPVSYSNRCAVCGAEFWRMQVLLDQAWSDYRSFLRVDRRMRRWEHRLESGVQMEPYEAPRAHLDITRLRYLVVVIGARAKEHPELFTTRNGVHFPVCRKACDWDYIVPPERGGATSGANARLMCAWCLERKALEVVHA